MKELPILSFDIDTTAQDPHNHLAERDLKEIYEKQRGVCTMVDGYKQSPIMLIASCPWNIPQSKVRTLCEQTLPNLRKIQEENVIDLVHTPFQDDVTGLVYKNLYCAECNSASDPVAWELKVDCDDMQPLEFSDGCDKVFIMGDSNRNLGCTRTLKPKYYEMISECDPSEVREHLGMRSHQTRIGNARNDDYSPLPLSFSIFMNFGFDGKTHILFTTSPDEQLVSQACPQPGQVYDPVNHKCRNVSCDEGYRLEGQQCVRVASYESDTTTNDITSLKYIEETVEVILTMKNVSYGEIVLLAISSVEEKLVTALARRFNISIDRIANLTVGVVNASSSSNSSDIEIIEIHRFTTPKPAGKFGKEEDSALKSSGLHPTKSAAMKSEDKESFDEPNLKRNLSVGIDFRLANVNVTRSHFPANYTAIPNYHLSTNDKDSKVSGITGSTLPSSKPMNVLKNSQSEEPNVDTVDIFSEYPNLNIRVRFLLKPAHKNRTFEKSVKSVVQSMTDLISSNSFSITINGTDFNVEGLENPINPTPIDQFCTKGVNAYISDEEFEVIRRFDGDEKENLTLVKINETGEVFKPGEYDLTLMVHGTVGNLSHAHVDRFVFVCIMPKIENAECPRITLGKPDYKIFDNKSVLFAGNLFNFSQYEYDGVENDSIKICAPDWSSSQKVINKTRWALVCGDDLLKLAVAESYLTFVLGLISLAFMLSVLTTYCLFEKLRNLPGINTMNLTISLFLGELVFIVSGSAKPHEAWLCSGVGMLIHYLFLASFFWMNVMSYDVYRTFARKCILTRIRDKSKFMPRYALYAWGSPLLIVVICAVLDFSGIPNVRIGYGNARAGGTDTSSQVPYKNSTSVVGEENSSHVVSIGCWIQEPNAAIAAFAGPMILILLSNFVMFTRTIICIRASTRMTQTSVRRSSMSHMAGHDDVMLYIRMSTVMGFTWVFGLASSIVSPFVGEPSKTICIVLHLFQILFIIFNCSQGLFIFFAFIFNRRVLSLYRGLVYRLRHLDGRERPLSSSSSRSTLGISLSQNSVSHIT